MPAGLNLRLKVWRISNLADDAIGGAITTGTVLYDSVYGRIQPLKPTDAIALQGLEWDRILRCEVFPSTLDIRENDEMEVIWPVQHSYINTRFKVWKVQRDGLHPMDRRNIMELTLTREYFSRAEA
jgi:hypothetical protein